MQSFLAQILILHSRALTSQLVHSEIFSALHTVCCVFLYKVYTMSAVIPPVI